MRVSNQFCAVCDNAHNGLNGRWCKVYSMYVDYMKEPLCGRKRFEGSLTEWQEAIVVE